MKSEGKMAIFSNPVVLTKVDLEKDPHDILKDEILGITINLKHYSPSPWKTNEGV